MAQRAIYRCLDEQQELLHRHGLNDRQRAERARSMAELADVRRTWWAVLTRHAFGNSSTIPLIYGRAAVIAEQQAESDARFWRETAQFWRDRAAGLPGDDGTGRGCVS